MKKEATGERMMWGGEPVVSERVRVTRDALADIIRLVRMGPWPVSVGVEATKIIFDVFDAGRAAVMSSAIGALREARLALREASVWYDDQWSLAAQRIEEVIASFEAGPK